MLGYRGAYTFLTILLFNIIGNKEVELEYIKLRFFVISFFLNM